jgi:light-regulated signal transduction histidine kinase (bacteriophytochrome)
LGAYTNRQRAFKGSELDFLQSVAHVLGAAIEHQQADEALYEVRDKLAQTTTILNQTRAELEKRTRELEQFAYVASHDLKAPIRAIANLSQWIEEDISSQLDAENLYQMQLLRGRVYRLEALMEGLLQYSRVGRLKANPERVDVEALLRQVIDILEPPPQFTVEIALQMPTLLTERLLLQEVFTHLIGNAIKHHPSPAGTVTIDVRERADAYEFAVTDDGEGIAPQFQERIFVIFQTLQARDEVENTGIGLAIVKKIVESRGGIIQVESQEGRGARFSFTWPIRK